MQVQEDGSERHHFGDNDGVGFGVLSIDYSGSEGYGAKFATESTGNVPTSELEDIERAQEWLVNAGCDGRRVGVYGGSYGGYLVYMALLRMPDRFACGVALRAVSDWAAYRVSDPLFTEQRFGDDPASSVYSDSSALIQAHQLQRRLLILHGVKDDNVPLWHAMAFLERVQRLGSSERVDLMLYPGEGHSFKKSYDWFDEYSRVFELFETELGLTQARLSSSSETHLGSALVDRESAAQNVTHN